VTRPNIIWIFGDQHRAQALGCNGNNDVKTPNLDKLASQGVNFSRAVAGFPLCCPFRGSLLTSLYPHKCVPGHQYQMDPKLETIAHPFNDAGYNTAYFGKWHVDGFHEKDGRAAMHIVPPERRGGFQKWVGYENNNLQWDSWVHGGEGKSAFHYKLPGYETDELTKLLIDYIKDISTENTKKEDQKPFFAVLSVQPPHNPYYAPEENMINHFRDEDFQPLELKIRKNVPDVDFIRNRMQTDLAGSYAMIENLDQNVGKIIDTLMKNGLGENTYIIFFSDHGDMHGSHGQFRKTTPYEESLRIPFIIGKPVAEKEENIIVNRKIEAPINHVDIAPTTLGLCGLEIPELMEGVDYSHYVYSDKSKDYEPQNAFIQSVIPTGHTDSVDIPWRGVVTQDGWKYVCFEGVDWMLFDLNKDPYEMVNIAHNSRYKVKKKELKSLLEEWIEKTSDNFQLPTEYLDGNAIDTP
jgi:arylsulfatase A-like enzyme